jgi:hypothetical protein
MFFTAEDERARIRGSVDPLGLLPVWSAFGRDIVGNLTTVSNSVRGFSILLIGRYLAAELLAQGKIGDDELLPVFLRFEQIAAYVREYVHAAGSDIRGIERVRKYQRELGDQIPIGDPHKGEILGDQRTYGLWGLFSVPARASGLLPVGPVGVEPIAREFVEAEYLPHLKPARAQLERLLLTPGTTLRLRKSDPVCTAVAGALSRQLRPRERAFFAETLRDAMHGHKGPGVQQRQAMTATLLRDEELLDHWVDRELITALAEAAAARGADLLAHRLRKVLALEALIAPADRLFAYLCARNGHTLPEVVRKLDEHWQREPLPHLPADTWEQIGPEFNHHMGSEIGQCATRVLEGFQTATWAPAIEGLLLWNELVMRARKSFAWVGITNGKLDVRYQDDERELPSRDELPQVWRNSYFLDSLRLVTKQLEVA